MIGAQEMLRPVALLIGAGAAIFASVYAIPLAYAAPADLCTEAHARDGRVRVELIDPRVLRAVTAATQMSGIQGHVVTCTLSMPYLSATVENLEGSYYVGITYLDRPL